MITLYSKEVSSTDEVQKYFEEYCILNGISLDFSKEKTYNAYSNQETAVAYIWFIRGFFEVLRNNFE